MEDPPSQPPILKRRKSSLEDIEAAKYVAETFKRYPRLCRIVDSTPFESVMAIPILFNCVTIGMSANCSTSCQPEQYWCTECSDSSRIFLLASEHILTFIFVVEWIVRMCVFGPKWLKHPVNFFDTVLVFVTGVLIVWFLEPIGIAPDAMRSIQVMRAFRLMRITRVVRSVPEFKEMWLLVEGLASSMPTLFWSVLIILFVLYMAGIMAIEIFRDVDWDFSDKDDIYYHSLWGDLPNSMFTLIQFMTLDSWTGVARPMMQRSPHCWLFFIAFIGVATFVLLNLITAVIVNNALDITKKDEDNAVKIKELNQKNEFKSLGELFYALDSDGSGTVDEEEFAKAFDLPGVAYKLKVLDFEQEELIDLFRLLDVDGGGELNLDEFLSGLSKLKGPARSKDLMKLQSYLGRAVRKLQAERPQEGGGPGPVEELAQQLDFLEEHIVRLETTWSSARSSTAFGYEGFVEAPLLPAGFHEGDYGSSETINMFGMCDDMGSPSAQPPSDVKHLTNGIAELKIWANGVNGQLLYLTQRLGDILDERLCVDESIQSGFEDSADRLLSETLALTPVATPPQARIAATGLQRAGDPWQTPPRLGDAIIPPAPSMAAAMHMPATPYSYAADENFELPGVMPPLPPRLLSKDRAQSNGLI